MFVREREEKIMFTTKLNAFFKSFDDENGNHETLDFVVWDKGNYSCLLREFIQILNQSRHKHPWSRDEDDYLRELFDFNWNFNKIAKELRRTKGSVVARLEKCCCLPNNFHEFEKYSVESKSELLKAMELERNKEI